MAIHPFSTPVVGKDYSTGAQYDHAVNSLGQTVLPAAAGERNIGTSYDYVAALPECNRTMYNPRAASAGSSAGAAGSAGATEVVISPVPAILVGVIFEADSTANEKVIFRDVAITGESAVGTVIGANADFKGAKFTKGLSVCGTAAGVSATILWRLL